MIGKDNLTSMVISIVVGAIVVGAVLIPICDSINQGGGSGGGGSTGVLVNDVSDILQGGFGLTIPDKYDSWVVYDNYEDWAEYAYDDIFKVAPTDNLSFDLDDLRELYEMPISFDESVLESKHDDWPSGFISIAVMSIYDENWDVFSGIYYGIDISSSGVSGTGFGFYIDTMDEDYGFIEYEDIDEFLLTFDMGEGIGGNLHVVAHENTDTGFPGGEFDWDVNSVSILSEDDNGWFLYDTDGGINIQWNNPSDSMSKLYHYGDFYDVNIDEDMVIPYVDVRVQCNSQQASASIDVSDIIIQDGVWNLGRYELDNGGTGTIVTADVGIPVTNGRIGYIVTDADLDNTEGDTIQYSFATMNYISTMSFRDGGESSGSSDSGITGTLIAVIPVFVILALLMGVVQYLRIEKGI